MIDALTEYERQEQRAAVRHHRIEDAAGTCPRPTNWTVGRLLQWTADYLSEHGADSPRLDAEVLLAEALGCQRIELYTRSTRCPASQPRAAFRDLVRRRAEGAPVAYLVGRREFYSLSFRVTPDVLIPRPETEFLVIALLDLARTAQPSRSCRSATWARAAGSSPSRRPSTCRRARLTAIDISPEALAVARANAAAHGVADRIEFVQSDLFAALPAERRFDFVVSNPPYVSRGGVRRLPRGRARTSSRGPPWSPARGARR